MSGFTPGPWRIATTGGTHAPIEGLTPEQQAKFDALNKVTPFRSNDGAWSITSDSGPVAKATMRADAKRGQGFNTPDPEGEANAQLIAAAPELLEACLALVNAIDPQVPTRKGKKSQHVEVPMEPYYVAPLAAARAAIAKAGQ